MSLDTTPSGHTLHAEVQGLKNIINVAQVVVSSLDLEEVLLNILHSAMVITDYPAGSIALYDDKEDALVLHAHVGMSEAFVQSKKWEIQRDDLTSRAIEHGEPLVIENVERTDIPVIPQMVAEGLRAVIVVPLVFQRNLVGVLYVNDFRARSPEQGCLHLLSVLASFATMSIDNARLHRKTLELACSDGLTGLYNHRKFKRDLIEEVQRAQRYDASLSIILLDVDDFKPFNDAFGHPKGDEVLRELALLLRDMLRGCDLIYRYGGEEFVVLLPETSLEKALGVAKRIRVRVENDSPRFPTGVAAARGVTVSVGVASFPEDGADHDSLLQRVDALMYAAKKQGKNKVYHRHNVSAAEASHE